MADLPDLGYALTLEPKDAIAYFEKKGYALSWNWFDLWQEAQAAGFTVAKAMRLDVLQDIRDAVTQALKEGKTAKWFNDTLTPILQAKGWWGRQLAGDSGGGIQKIQLGSPSRLRLIYHQNLQSSYMAARWKQMKANAEARPYWQYLHSDAVRYPRLAHLALHGKVFRHDDPVWNAIYPPNGFGCKCRVRAFSDKDLERRGLDVTSSLGVRISKEIDIGVDPRTGEIIKGMVDGVRVRAIDRMGRDAWVDVYPDPGFSYNPGAASFQPDLELYAEQIARQYIAATLSGPDFARFVAGDVAGNIPIAVLKAGDRQLIGADNQSVLLSQEILQKQLDEHPEIGLADYQRVPDILDRGEVYQQGDERLVYLAVGGVMYRAAVKATEDGSANYLLSLFKTSDLLVDKQLRQNLRRVR